MSALSVQSVQSDLHEGACGTLSLFPAAIAITTMTPITPRQPIGPKLRRCVAARGTAAPAGPAIRGCPQCGQEAAASETSLSHTGHFISGIADLCALSPYPRR